jgi:hypothetical protein
MEIIGKGFKIKNRDIMGELDVDIKIKMTLEDLRILSRYLEGEFLNGMDNVIMDLEDEMDEEEIFYYEKLKKIMEGMTDGIYRALVETERTIIDELKKHEIDEDEIIELMAEDEYDKERIENVYMAVDEMNNEEKESQEIFDKLDIYGRMILSKIKESDEELYMPLVFKFFWFMYNSVDKSGEVIFTENSLEDLLNLDREGLEVLLDQLVSIEVKVGNRKGRLIEYFGFLNDNTMKIEYNLFAVNPRKYLTMDHKFKICKPEEIVIKILD